MSSLLHFRPPPPPPPVVHLLAYTTRTEPPPYPLHLHAVTTSEAAQTLSNPNGQIHSADQKPSTKAPTQNINFNDFDFQKWRRNEAGILQDIEDVWYLTKEILDSSRYECGQRLSTDDQKSVVEKLLAYHSHREDKIGCGNYIMVDQHPQFDKSKCLFVVRTDSSWIDFSYLKCLRSYIRDKYPSYAERFIK